MLNTYQLNAVKNLVRPIPPHLVTLSRLIPNDYDVHTQAHIREQFKEQLKTKTKEPRINTRSALSYRITGHDFKKNGHFLAVERAKVKDARKASPESVIEYIDYLTTHIRDEILKKIEPRILDIKQKFKTGEWEKLDWQKYGLNEPDKLRRLNSLFSLHNVHYSIISPMLIAYYPNLEHFRQGREVRTKLGKYLTQFKDQTQLTDLEIKSITEAHTARVQAQAGWEVRFIESTDGTGWVNIYGQGERFNSCMTNSKAVQVYAHEKSVLKLAYMLEGGSVIARAIVRTQNNYDDTGTDRKGYLRIYPDANGHAEGRFMLDTLKNLGYEKQTNLNGCLLLGIPHERDDGVYMCPYIDYGNGGNQTGEPENIDGKTYIVIGNGEYDLANTGGWTSNVEKFSCDDCGDEVDEDEIEYIESVDRHICNSCRDNDYTWVVGRGGEEYYVYEEDAVWVDGCNQAYDQDWLADNNIYECEVKNTYFHIDDLCNTLRGLIHNSIAQPLDHEDDEGNSYAYENDAHQLSDGTWCHEDDADELQAEIDAENDEDEDETETQPTTQGATDENN